MKKRVFLFVTFFICAPTTAWPADVAILRAQIENVIPRARGEVGVAIKHLESGTDVMVNADKTYPMASTYKVPILVELFYQRSAGKLSLLDRVEIAPSEVHPGGTIALLLDGPGLQMSIHNLINLMMRVSDNSAADILINKLGSANITARMRTLHLDSIRVDRTTLDMIRDQESNDQEFNRTERDVATPRHMTLLLEKMVRGEIVDRATSEEIIEFMSHSMIGQTRIPGSLPEGTRVVHKTGTISGSTNDTGIIFLPDGRHLLITVLTREAKAPAADRERVIADIAKYAYDYFLFNPSGK